MPFHITSLYVGLLAILAIILAGGVLKHRIRSELSVGYDNEAMHGAIRRFGNFTEYVPIALMVILMLENSGIASWALHLAGGALVLGRVLHAWGLDPAKPATAGRFIGTNLTFLVLLVGGGYLIYSFVAGQM